MFHRGGDTRAEKTILGFSRFFNRNFRAPMCIYTGIIYTI